MIYPLVAAMAAEQPGRPVVTVAGRMLGFTRQAYYKWVHKPVSDREASDAQLTAQIVDIHGDDPQFGYRLIFDELADQGYRGSERRVWRLCSINGVDADLGKHRKSGSPGGVPADDDLVRREFHADAPNRLWLTDITEHRTREGKLFLCAVKDVWGNKIVGWSISDRMKASLAVTALTDAYYRRGCPQRVVIHSDRGSQFGSRKFIRACARFGMRRSMGQAHTCADNSAMESFFSLLQKNVLNQHKIWATRQVLRLAIITWIEAVYNRCRRQRQLGRLTPVEYETIHARDYELAA